MAKKALISTTETMGANREGYRVIQVEDVANIFEVDSTLEWKDCDDNIEADKYWFHPATNTFKKSPNFYSTSTAGELAKDAEGNITENYVWDWDNEVWTKVAF